MRIPVAARVMDLQHPERKMSKSVDSPLGTVLVLDEPARDPSQVPAGGYGQRIRGARYNGQTRGGQPAVDPGGRDRRQARGLAGNYSQYGPLKADAAEAVIELLQPLQQRFAELEARSAETGASWPPVRRRQAMAGPKMTLVRERLGLPPLPASGRRGAALGHELLGLVVALELAAHLGLAVHAATLGLLDELTGCGARVNRAVSGTTTQYLRPDAPRTPCRPSSRPRTGRYHRPPAICRP